MRKILKRREKKEDGNSLAFLIILFPLLMACFGFAIDIAALTLTQNTLQASADAAAQSVIAQSDNSFANNRPGLTNEAARNEFIKYYDANRKGGYGGAGFASNNSPFLICQGTAGAGKAVLSGCGFNMTSFAYSPAGLADGKNSNITATVNEKSQTLFLRIIGITEFTYEIKTSARITQSFN